MKAAAFTVPSALLLLLGLSAQLNAQTPVSLRGDLTGDRQINVQDATLALKGIVGLQTLTPDQQLKADANNDGKLEVRDVTLILQAAVGLLTLPPMETPTETVATLTLNQPYEGGARVQAPWAGLTFTVPDGWSGGMDAQTTPDVLLASKTVSGFILIRALAVEHQPPTLNDMAVEFAQPLALSSDLALSPVGQPETEGDRVTASYAGQNQNGPLVGYRYGRGGLTGQMAMAILVGEEKDSGRLRELGEALVMSFQFSPPQIDPWKRKLAGKEIHRSSSSSSPSSTNDVVIRLACDGRSYYHSWGLISDGNVSVPHDVEETGLWRLFMNLAGPVLLLEPENGTESRAFAVADADSPEVLLVDEKPARFTSLETCP